MPVDAKIMDVDKIIRESKLGRERKDAQVKTCTAFAAALYDVLSAQGIACQMVTALKSGVAPWAHAVIEVAGRYYDSMGEFSADIYRSRAKIHPKVTFEITYQPDYREDCYEAEFDELHAFFVKALNKTIRLINLSGWHIEDPGWWVHNDLGSVCRESGGKWYGYHKNKSGADRIGPFKTVEAAANGVRQSSSATK